MFAQPHPSSSQHRRTLGVLFAVVLGAMSLIGEASAATYTVWLKSGPDSPYEIGGVKCAAGTINDAGSFNMTISQNCFGAGQPSATETFSGTGTLNTSLVQTNANNAPVSTADGISFTGTAGTSTLILSWSSNSPNIGTRTFTWSNGTNTVNGQYYLFIPGSLPEPETLWLALVGLSALALFRHKRRRS